MIDQVHLLVSITDLYDNSTQFLKLQGQSAVRAIEQLIDMEGELNTPDAVKDHFFNADTIIEWLELPLMAFQLVDIPEELVADLSDWGHVVPKQIGLYYEESDE